MSQSHFFRIVCCTSVLVAVHGSMILEIPFSLLELAGILLRHHFHVKQSKQGSGPVIRRPRLGKTVPMIVLRLPGPIAKPLVSN